MALADLNDLERELRAIVGADAVETGEAARIFFSTDIASRGADTAAVVRVADTAELSAIVKLCTSQGVAVVPRGGGFSYTGGYVPLTSRTVTIDMRGLDQVLEVNHTDMYVRVGAGCTWAKLYEALRAKDLRTPYFGPMSGFGATIGGALSQGSFFLGSTEYGAVAESVLSLEVVLANGDVIHTGTDSADGVLPFFRSYGPDLTGLFLSDTGTLGFKTVATLKLIPFPPYQAYGSFSFDRGADAMAALSEIGRAGLAAEAYCWDPYFVEIMSAISDGTGQDLAMLWGIVRNGAGVIDGITAGLRVALNGKRVFKPNTFIIQIMIDDVSAAGAAERLKRVRAIARRHQAHEIAPTIPRATRGTPFVDFNTATRRIERRNLPTNSIFPHSRVPAADKAIRALFAEHAAEMDRHDVKVGIIMFAVGKQAMCIEPLLYWNDPEHFLHNRVEQRSDVAALAGYADRPDATRFAMELREKLKRVMKAHGAIHVQIGKAYDYLPSREPRVRVLVQDIKASLDPRGLVNPGSLGLGG